MRVQTSATGSADAYLLRLPIDRSPFVAATQPVPVPSGHFVLWIFAGQPPCWMGWVPMCDVRGDGRWESAKAPEYGCRAEVDLEPGDDRSVAVDGLPRLLPGQIPLDYPDCAAPAGS